MFCKNWLVRHAKTFLMWSQNPNLSKFSTNVELTSVRYQEDTERGDFSVLQETDLKHFREILGCQEGLVTDPLDLEAWNTDWLRSIRGAGKLVLKPKTTEEVQSILKYCNERRIAVVPQGGNTGVVGGSVPVFDEIILSTALMNKIIGLDDSSDVLVCEAGCILETLNEYLMERGLIMPLDLGAKGSCNIGGNASTNAGGLRFLRYGSLHSTILGIEAVIADGTKLDCLNTMKKDNTGYDLKHLFIGSEGTLGIITKIAIHCPTKPKSVNLAFLGLSNFENILQTVKLAKQNLGEILSACEYIDSTAIHRVLDNLKLKSPIPNSQFYMVIECSGSNEVHDKEKLYAFIENLINSKLVDDGTIAADNNQIREIWCLRERIPEALLKDGHVYSYDLSIPIISFNEIVQEMKEHLGTLALKCCGFGHLGDGNIHLNITVPNYDPNITNQIETFLYDWIRAKKGSISAEHGLGFTKKNLIHCTKSPESVAVMKKLKHLFDPNGILNPYKVLT